MSTIIVSGLSDSQNLRLEILLNYSDLDICQKILVELNEAIKLGNSAIEQLFKGYEPNKHEDKNHLV